MRFGAKQLELWSGGEWEGVVPELVGGFCKDTREIGPGELYVAIRGERFDGHGFVAQALGAGAAGALVERGVDVDAPDGAALLRVDDSVAALGCIARGWRKMLGVEVVGVTGSVGKTTVKEMLVAILSQVMSTVGTRGNWNNEIGLPLSMLLLQADTQAGVFEAGMNHAGEIAVLSEIMCPQWGVVTAVGPAHIEFFDSVEAIAREKGELLRSLPAGGHAVLCSDDEYFGILGDCVACELTTVSVRGDADYVVGVDVGRGRLVVSERSSGDVLDFAWNQPGEHNALNAAYAIAVARGMGVAWEYVEQGLAAYQPAAMRWQVDDIGGVTVVNDAYNANPLSMRAALKSFAEMGVSGRKWVVLGDMLELGRQASVEHVGLGKAAAGSDWCGVVAVGGFAGEIADGLRQGGFAGGVWQSSDAADAAEVLRDRIMTGDAVLLKASRGLKLEDVVNELSKSRK